MVANSINLKLGEQRSFRQDEQDLTSIAYGKTYNHYFSRGGKLSLSAFAEALNYRPSKEEMSYAHLVFACGGFSNCLIFRGSSDYYQHKTLAGLIHVFEGNDHSGSISSWNALCKYNPFNDFSRLSTELELLRDYSLPERKTPSVLEVLSEHPSGGHWQ